MKLRAFIIAIATMTCVLAYAQEKQPHPGKEEEKSGATNKFQIHLQDGFDGKHEAVLMVDGKEVYKGRPLTMMQLGVAHVIYVTNAVVRPVVTFLIPDKKIKWVKQIDLTGAPALGIDVRDDKVEFRQAKEFWYD